MPSTLVGLSRLTRGLLVTRVALIAAIIIAAQAPQPALAYEHRMAVLFGFENYEQGESKGIFRNLPFTANDLESVGTALSEIGFDPIYVYSDIAAPTGSKFEYRKIPPSRAEFESTISKVLDSLESKNESNNQQSPNRLLLIYFTGHGGTFNKTYPNRMLALPNTQVRIFPSYAAVWPILEQMSSTARNVDKMLIIDACADYLGDGPPSSLAVTPDQMAGYLFSSSPGEMSFFDRELKTSVFTHYLVDAIKQVVDGTGNGDRKLTFTKVQDYVEDYVPNHARKEQKKNVSQTMPSRQNPLGSSNKKIVLWPPTISSSDQPTQPQIRSESAEGREARLMGYTQAIYGRRE